MPPTFTISESYAARVRPSTPSILVPRRTPHDLPTAAAEACAVIGESVAHYRILAPIGAGGMGELFLAEDTKLGRRVALKFLARELTADAVMKERFLREARAASAIDHPNVCAIYGIEESADGRSCIVMAYYEGRTLDRILNEGPLPVGDAVALASQVAEGLSRAHALGIVHRDIKPSNVILTEDGTAKILDFGVAKVGGAPALTVTDAVLGSPGYMAPEQITAGEVDHRADLWAVGVLLYSAITGRPPFVGEGIHGSIYAILNTEPPALSSVAPGVPSAIEDLVGRCLRKDPRERLDSAAELARALRAVLDGLDPGATTSLVRAAVRARDTRSRIGARGARAGVPVTRRPVWLAIGGAVVLVAAGIAVARPLFGPGPHLRVAVLPAEIEGVADSIESRLAASAVEAGLVRALAGLRQVSVSDPAELRGLRDVADMRRAVAADEMIRARLSAADDEWQVVLERLHGADGTLLGARPFRVAQNPPTTLANALMVQIGHEYPRRRSREVSRTLEVDDETFAEYTRLERAFRARDQRGLTPNEMRAQMGRLVERAPKFADAHLLQAGFALTRYLADHDPELLREAEAAARRARSLAPEDARPVGLSIRVALAAGDLAGARARLDELKKLNPGDVEILRREAELADAEGRPEDAWQAMTAAVRRRGTRTLYQVLADLETKQGRVPEARSHLDTLIARFPGDRYPRSKLAQLELLYGEPARADSIYGDLIAEAPGNALYVGNRGLARMLLGRQGEAARDFRACLDLAPDNLTYLLNLADVQDLSGARDSAAALYTLALARGGDSNEPRALQVRAQCLAHLGRSREAVIATQELLRTESGNSDALYVASLVYTLAGDRSSALVNAERALEKGVGPRWFGLRWFAPLLSDEAFREKLEETTARPSRAGPRARSRRRTRRCASRGLRRSSGRPRAPSPNSPAAGRR